MSTYREAPPARPLESAWARRARRAKRIARWPLDHVRTWHIVTAITLGPAAALINSKGVWGEALRGLLILLGAVLAVFFAFALLVLVVENWKSPISKWRWPE